MPQTVLVQFCTADDFDTATQTCAAPFWGPYSTVIPPLPMEDAWPIAASIAMLWGIGFVIKRSRKAGEETG